MRNLRPCNQAHVAHYCAPPCFAAPVLCIRFIWLPRPGKVGYERSIFAPFGWIGLKIPRQLSHNARKMKITRPSINTVWIWIFTTFREISLLCEYRKFDKLEMDTNKTSLVLPLLSRHTKGDWHAMILMKWRAERSFPGLPYRIKNYCLSRINTWMTGLVSQECTQVLKKSKTLPLLILILPLLISILHSGLAPSFHDKQNQCRKEPVKNWWLVRFTWLMIKTY